MLVWLNCPLFSQDSLKVPVIEYNGSVGLFIDSTTAKNLSHKLEEGNAAKKELVQCDSSLTICDSINSKNTQIIDNLNSDIDLAGVQFDKEREKNNIWKEKFQLCDDARKDARKQRWVWGGVGIVFGGSVGIIVGVLVK